MKEFNFTHFKRKDIPQMRKTFNKAFSDYLIPMRLTETAFERKIIHKTNINFKLSVGSYYKNKLVGFLFHSINTYENKTTCYNGGTGVIPDCRGHQLTYKMYQHVIPKLIHSGVDNCVLEVVSTNIPAIRSYEKIGFKKSKFFHCMKINPESRYLDSIRLKNYDLRAVNKPRWSEYEQFCDYTSSFLDSFQMLKINKKNENFLEVYNEKELVGFLIFNRKMGRIEHLGVKPEYRGNGIGAMMVKKAQQICGKKPVYVLNLNEKSYGLLSFFLRIGFKNDIDQFELTLNLPEKV